MRYLAFLVSLATAGLAGWLVYRELATVFGDWIPLAGGAAVGLVVLPLLYFPLLRPVGDIVQDRVLALGNRLRDDRTGTGLDDVPERLNREPTAPRIARCGICGGPGGPVCDACHEKMAGR
ncbi:MAG TPA: hypothetical protein VM285_05355 [Polyangia bacterium]|nr:hypothetical protein [Polyangia bacterium]